MTPARINLTAVAAALLVLPLLTGSVGAQEARAWVGDGMSPSALRQIEALLAAKAQRTPAQRKVSSQLLDVLAGERPVRAPAPSRVGPAPSPVASGEGDSSNWVEVDIRADVTAEVLSRIEALGGSVVNSVPRYRAIRARLPVGAVESLAELDVVQFIRAAVEPEAWARSGTWKLNASEGDVAHQANVARTQFAVDGSGIGIGVISTGIELLAERQASGDLPEWVTVLPGQRGFGAEGTAMLEIVQDLAPGADLYFATGQGSQAQFAANIEALCEAGADVIVDDIYYGSEPAFQDGVIARGVNAAVAGGCFYFSAAGNAGNLNDETSGTWEGDFVAAGRLAGPAGSSLGVTHDFGGDGVGNRITAAARNGFYVLQWADPLGASRNDYDLFLLDPTGQQVLDRSTNTQNGTQDPIEFLWYPLAEELRLVVVKADDAENRYLRVAAITGRLAFATDGATWGHAATANAIGVAAVDVQSAVSRDRAFTGSESVETFSSDGPRRIFFKPNGTPVTPGDFSSTGGESLQKPDVAAADNVSTSTPGFSTFKGTSAAAPHAAAMAALILEGAGGTNNVSMAELRAALAESALDIEASGVDRDSGAGIVMAPAAVQAEVVAPVNRNRRPEVARALADLTLGPDDAPVTVDLAAAFTDPEGDDLRYTAVASDSFRVATSAAGSRLSIRPLVPGRSTVRVVATDPAGLSLAIRFGVAISVGNRDYDLDNDGLIDVGNLAQLDAIRYDLTGDGVVDSAVWRPYYAAFPAGALGMGCPPGRGCEGYELTADLDFDTDGSGGPSRGDRYWNGGAGWEPLGVLNTLRGFPVGRPLRASFYGNGHTISNLFVDRPREIGVGLFGYVWFGTIEGVGLENVSVTGRDHVGGLGGSLWLVDVDDSYATGRVSGRDLVGGLIGGIQLSVTNSYAGVRVSGTGTRVGGLVGDGGLTTESSHASGDVSGREHVGGLLGASRGWIVGCSAVGSVSGEREVGGLAGSSFRISDIGYAAIRYSYATGGVSGEYAVGGLVGQSVDGRVSASYATGSVSGTSNVGGLVGDGVGARVTASYATGRVSGGLFVGGLLGRGNHAVLTAGYTTGRVAGKLSGKTGALVGDAFGARVVASYWDTRTSGSSRGTAGEGQATGALQGPRGYGGIYKAWNVDVDDDGKPDDPWDFGTSAQYPVLRVDMNGDGQTTWQEFGYQVRDSPTLKTTVMNHGDVELAWTAVDVSHWNLAPELTYTLAAWGADDRRLKRGLTELRYTDRGVPGGTYEYSVAAVVNGGEATRSQLVPVKVPDRTPDPPDPETEAETDGFTVSVPCEDGLCRVRTGVSVSFVDTSEGTVVERHWDFGDGTTSTSARPEHAWTSPGFYTVSLTVSDGKTSSRASVVLLVEASDPAGSCEPDAETLCLQDSRYAVTVAWRTGTESGLARVVLAGTNDSGLFRFFDRDNWELLIKVLDGCTVNGHVWVYGASTTDLGFLIRVTDTVTGTVKEYRNEPGLPASAITDGTAFPEGCAP